MPTFSVTANELEDRLAPLADPLFSLCFFHTALLSDATELWENLILDAATDQASYDALSGRDAALSLAHKACMDFYGRKMRKKAKAELLKAHRLPFPVTPELVSLLNLPGAYKTPLFCVLALGLSPQETGEIVKRPASFVERQVEKGLKRVGLTRAQAAEALASLRLGEGSFARLFDKLMLKLEEKDVGRKRSAARFKRKLDAAMPFVAAGIVALCILAVLAVELGWFGTTPSNSDYQLTSSDLLPQSGMLEPIE